jgi:phosphatidylserine/phosphatidylglycerophosphate/cardiolipin synthase-like enzyme
MKSFIVILLFPLVFSCSKEGSDKPFGSFDPARVIAKDKPVFTQEDKVHSASTLAFQKHLDTLLETELVHPESLSLLQNKDTYPQLLSMIKESQKYFYINVLSLTCDSTTEPFVRLLEEKAKKGVDVRLMVNKFFAYLSMSCLNRLENSGVKVKKVKTHASYFLNDAQELMIGSQSVARMFFLADGFNSLDRDMMLFTKGALATDAFRDFVSIWSMDLKESSANDLAEYNQLLKNDYGKNLRGAALYGNDPISNSACRFVSERPGQGISDVQTIWKEAVKINTKELYFSGVKVELKAGELGKLIKAKSNSGVDTHYIGNGHASGNGELTMVMDEWIKEAPSLIAPLISWPRDWDKDRLLNANQKLYDDLKKDAKINVWGYFNFIHYKVWLFDFPGVFIGSANFDESKFGGPFEAGVYCLDSRLHTELKAELLRDQKNSSLYKMGEK